MITSSHQTYEPAGGKRLAKEVAAVAVVIGLVFGWRAHDAWWFILITAALGGVATYWFWRACDYLVFRLLRSSGA